jgi:hypothetical protein
MVHTPVDHFCIHADPAHLQIIIVTLPEYFSITLSLLNLLEVV